MKFNWNYIYTFINNLPSNNASNSTVVAFLTGQILSLHDDAKDGKFFSITPHRGKFFQIVTNENGIELLINDTKGAAVSEFRQAYQNNPMMLLGSLVRKEILATAS